MSLAPSYSAHRLFSGVLSGAHTLEVFLDFTCPFSAKLWKTLYTQVIPHIRCMNLAVSIIFRHQVQPWHPNSTLLHEASLAVEKINPQGFVGFSNALFDKQAEYFDEATVNLTRTDIYRKLAELALSVNAIDDRQTLLQLLDIQASDKPQNLGNAVSGDLKYHIKLARAQSIHVSPTVVFDGIRDDSVSSSWTLEQWQKWLETKL
ncbi:hypothetical protein COEREDRAFT_12101 [Coemansia reversa NRRL 1564]|uniref:Uncharacterized protein n=1 Tax=Coemansia reversa (strain ATCC 12441 / NRRL 1564) TaxID=763665 RepID=A0A2G5B1H8_COERN|nr:hypothetical protein COEREDRAFT_12101 [Coemansia reversa NRRL 1564]|eukprot:PIA12851.1 hypothetical protein COEREDRAFT_12101 [Coemansia reversa NRRL 1564]